MATAKRITILGFGSLLSERSTKTTFPDATNFRLVIVNGYRRSFAHPAAIFFKRGIADLEKLRFASLSAEECEGASFICTAFEATDIGMDAFREREEEFRLELIPFSPLVPEASMQPSANGSEGQPASSDDTAHTGSAALGLACLRWTDDEYIAQWGRDRYERDYLATGAKTIWGWAPDSGLEPCHPYLRHCVLAATKLGDACLDSFLDQTYLVDRTTPLRTYLDAHPEVMSTLPPPELQERYGG